MNIINKTLPIILYDINLRKRLIKCLSALHPKRSYDFRRFYQSQFIAAH